MKLKRFMLIFFTALFSVTSSVILLASFILYRYSSSHVDNEIIDAVHSCGKTEFFCLDYSDKNKGIYNFKKIENADINGGVKLDYVEYDTIPQNLKNAFIAIEDKRFYEHNGIDYMRTLSAAVNLIVTRRATYGGSTITQQLVKNLTGNNQKRIDRKLKEAFCALSLEKNHDKSEIIEMYLNVINLSNGCIGIGSASRYYFDKAVGELDLCESAALAAITNNPSLYDPLRHPENNKKRRDLILGCMLDLEYITNEQYLQATRETPKTITRKNNIKSINSWFIDTVINDVIGDLSTKYDISKENASALLYRGGYKIYTSMDPQIQKSMESYFEDTDNFPKDSDGNMPQASMIIIDPNSGDVLGIVGSVGEKNGNRLQNYATDTKRPPGSTIKPLSVYGLAIEKGLVNWSTVIEDSPIINDSNGNPWPSNAGKIYHGNVTLKYAVANSLNTIPVKLLHDIGNENAFSFLTDKLKIASLNAKSDMGDASLALGQPSKGISLKELTAAYSIFSDGIMCKARTYYKVTDSDGRVILDNKAEQERVISAESASIMTKLLQTVVEEGTASGYITITDRVNVSGKTGTSQNSYDKYFIGYTPELLAGVWQGYEYPKTIDCYKGNYAICIWNDIMRSLYSSDVNNNIEHFFKISENVKEFSYDPRTGLPPCYDYDVSVLEEGWFSCKDKIFGNK